MPFTKGDVNRAGKLLLDLRERMQRDGAEQVITDSDEPQLEAAWEALTWWRSLYGRPLSSVAANLRYHIDREDGRIEGHIEVTQRLKRLDTLIGKLEREPGNVTQMHDIGGVRALLPSLGHVHAVSRRLRKTWTIIKVRDYIAEPKKSGYRALHLIVQRQGRPIEVQLRTIAQDAWANLVEDHGRETGVGLKFGSGDTDVRAKFAIISEILASLDQGELSVEELRAAMKSVR